MSVRHEFSPRERAFGAAYTGAIPARQSEALGSNGLATAHYHAGLVVRHALFGSPVKVNHESIPWATFTDPELVHVGLLEDEAGAHSGVIRVLRWPYRENDRAQVERATEGHIKVVTDRNGEILGVTIVGAHAAESIAPWALAISQKLNVRALASMIVPYPTYAEVWKTRRNHLFHPI